MEDLERRTVPVDLIDSDGEEDEVEVPDEEDAASLQPKLTCLFSSFQAASADELWAHTKKEYGLDFEAERARLALSFYETVRLVNYLRLCAKEGREWKGTLERGADWVTDERYLIPVMQDDALLCSLQDTDDAWSDDDDDDEEGGAAAAAAAAAAGSADEEKAAAPTEEDKDRVLARLARENAELRSRLAGMHESMAAMSESLGRFSFGPGAGDGGAKEAAAKGGEADEDKAAAGRPQTTIVRQQPDNDSYYFDSYSDRSIHETMLRDRVRTEAYRDAFYLNPEAVRGKKVLDIGCGTGILSMFAAKAGAGRVVGIDRAAIIDKARVIVRENGLDDRVTLVKSKTEEAVLPDGFDKADIIVSEWMGYFLLFESMLPTVLYARDRWLAPGGTLYPDLAVMHVVGIDAAALRERSHGFWSDVYGFDMRTMLQAGERVRGGTVIDVVPAGALMTEPAELRRLDLMTVRDEDLDWESSFELVASRDADFEAFCVYFDTDFARGLAKPVTLPTGPQHTPTHWVQTSFYLSEAVPMKAGERVAATMKARRREQNPREYDVSISYSVNGGPRRCQDFAVLANDGKDE